MGQNHADVSLLLDCRVTARADSFGCAVAVPSYLVIATVNEGSAPSPTPLAA
jgi:hypothetical protein